MKKNNKTKLNKYVKFLIIVIIILVICIISLFCIKLKKTNELISNLKISNKEFHKIEVKWNKLKEKNTNYKVILSKNNISFNNIIEQLNSDKLNENYILVDAKDKNMIEINDILSNEDYYILVVSYKNKGNDVIYQNISATKKIHTLSLDLNNVASFEAKDITDTKISLEWTSSEIKEKNLDKTSIETSYSIYKSNDFATNENNYIELKSNIKDNKLTINDLESFTKYSFIIKVNAFVDGKSISSREKILSVTTKPSAVKNIKASSNSSSKIDLTWEKYIVNKKNTDETEAQVTYTIYDSYDDKEYKVLKEDITDTKYTDSDLKDNTKKYYYLVAKIKLNGDIYDSIPSEKVNATTQKKVVYVPQTSSNSSTSTNSSSQSNNKPTTGGYSSSDLSAAEKDRQARDVAKKIADEILSKGYTTDLDKVQAAASKVSEYYFKGVHVESGVDYRTPYGVFIKGESSCAGTTRALGLVLEYMGYSWQHANENQWTHQWVIVTMDGKVGYADGQVGMVGYGTHPYAE